MSTTDYSTSDGSSDTDSDFYLWLDQQYLIEKNSGIKENRYFCEEVDGNPNSSFIVEQYRRNVIGSINDKARGRDILGKRRHRRNNSKVEVGQKRNKQELQKNKWLNSSFEYAL